MPLSDPPPPNAFDLRYGAPSGVSSPVSSPVIASILAHRSVRAYAPTPLPDGLLETLIAAGQSAPTSSNLQLWSVIVVDDADKKARLSELVGGQKHVR